MTNSEVSQADLEIAREAAAKAQVSPVVAKMIRSGDYDEWPNVQGAINAVITTRNQIGKAVG